MKKAEIIKNGNLNLERLEISKKEPKGKAYYVIRDLVTLGYWDKHEQAFRGIYYAYKMNINSEPAFDTSFQKAREESQAGVELIKVYE